MSLLETVTSRRTILLDSGLVALALTLTPLEPTPPQTETPPELAEILGQLGLAAAVPLVEARSTFFQKWGMVPDKNRAFYTGLENIVLGRTTDYFAQLVLSGWYPETQDLTAQQTTESRLQIKADMHQLPLPAQRMLSHMLDKLQQQFPVTTFLCPLTPNFTAAMGAGFCREHSLGCTSARSPRATDTMTVLANGERSLAQITQVLIHEILHNYHDLQLFAEAKAHIKRSEFFAQQHQVHLILDTLCTNLIEVGKEAVVKYFRYYYTLMDEIQENRPLFDAYAQQVLGFTPAETAGTEHLGLVLYSVLTAQLGLQEVSWQQDQHVALQQQLAPIVLSFLEHILLSPTFEPVTLEPGDAESVIQYARYQYMLAVQRVLSHGLIAEHVQQSQLQQALGIGTVHEKEWAQLWENIQQQQTFQKIGTELGITQLRPPEPWQNRGITIEFYLLPSTADGAHLPVMLRCINDETADIHSVLFMVSREDAEEIVADTQHPVVWEGRTSETDTFRFGQSSTVIQIKWQTNTQYGRSTFLPWQVQLNTAQHSYTEFNLSQTEKQVHSTQALPKLRGAALLFAADNTFIGIESDKKVLDTGNRLLALPEATQVHNGLCWDEQLAVLGTHQGVVTASTQLRQLFLPNVKQFREILKQVKLYNTTAQIDELLAADEGMVYLYLEQVGEEYVYKMEVRNNSTATLPQYVWFEQQQK